MYYVTVVEIDRVYGGPQEGGWWYDCAYPILEYSGKKRQAMKVAKKWREEHEQPDGRPDRYSVIGGPDTEVWVTRRPVPPPRRMTYE